MGRDMCGNGGARENPKGWRQTGQSRIERWARSLNDGPRVG